ncbi:hypothetical protein TSUD_166400 [Trifolium subterraneum]|uniref:Uncharacterized protein n=1 Tax=Trifolium subterraneum TaxID=3900 RepID=A0A2Z6MV00_TRISU|nr:hypothetical protein TSUD_166400 [Trifolium subterraneum]
MSIDESTGETPPPQSLIHFSKNSPGNFNIPKANVRGKPSKNTGIEKLKPFTMKLRVRHNRMRTIFQGRRKGRAQGRGKSISENNCPQPFNNEDNISSLNSISSIIKPQPVNIENHPHVLPSIIQENNNTHLTPRAEPLHLKEVLDVDDDDDDEWILPCTCYKCNPSVDEDGVVIRDDDDDDEEELIDAFLFGWWS